MLQDFLENTAKRVPNKTALICGKRQVTYLHLDEAANRQACQLEASGVLRNDRIAICLENSIEAAVAVFGVLKAGAVFLMLNPETKFEKLSYILQDCGAKALITTAERLTGWPQAPPTPNIITGGNSGLSSARLPRRGIDIDLAALVYTSGSTGSPKGVMLTHLNMESTANSVAEYLGNNDADVVLNVLPLSFGYGLYQLLVTCLVGATLVIERSFTYPFTVIETIARERVTGLPLVPTIIARLLQLDLGSCDLSSLRYISSAAAGLPPAHIKQLRAILPRVEIFSMYGLTECQRASYLPPDQIDQRPESVGRGMPNEEVFVVDEYGAEVCAGVVGELVVRGSNVMKGYWNLPEETDRVLKPGPIPGERVLYSGDLFRRDEDGYLYFVGRKDDIIKSRGEKVSPREVEIVLCNMRQVTEAAVIGVPDEAWGQAVKAFVITRQGETLTEREVIRHCAAHLESFMVPKHVSTVCALPKLANGKLDRHALATL